MGNTIVQATYDMLTAIAQQFTAQADSTQQMYDRVAGAVDQLRNGNWVGEGAAAFFSEMDADALPALQRMVVALQTGGEVTAELSELMRNAEEAAASRYGQDQLGALLASGALGVAVGGGGGGAGGGAGGPKDRIGAALGGADQSAISKIIAGASPAEKAAIIADRKLMERLRKTLTPAELRAVGKELVNNIPTIPDGPIKDQLATLAVSKREVDGNTAKHMIDGTILSYHMEDLQQPPNVDDVVRQAGLDPDRYTIYLAPPDNTQQMIVQKEGVLGFTFGGSTNIYMSKEASADDIRATLVHEVNHARNAPITTVESRYESEFRAYWVEGGRFDKIADPAERAQAIKEHVLGGYEMIATEYDSNPAVKKAIDAYTRPTGNLTNK